MGRFRDFVWRSSFFPRKLSFTREGKIVVLISIGLGVAAINTGNNLLYLVFSISLALIVISGILSERNLRNLHGAGFSLIRAVAGIPTIAIMSIVSGERRLSAYSIEVWPLLDGGSVDPARFGEVGRDDSLEGTCVIKFDKRGSYPVKGLVVSTSFPFSFFKKSMVVPAQGTVIVHPTSRHPSDMSIPVMGEGEDLHRPVAGRGHEFFGVRDFRDGDNPRHVHHRLSAEREYPVVREFEQMGDRVAWIALVNIDQGWKDGHARVERAIETCAGLAGQFLANGRRVGLATASGLVTPGIGPSQALRIMDYLATVPVLRMNMPGVELSVREALEGVDPSSVVWVRPDEPEGAES